MFIQKCLVFSLIPFYKIFKKTVLIVTVTYLAKQVINSFTLLGARSAPNSVKKLLSQMQQLAGPQLGYF